VRRAARLVDGWHPVGPSPEAFRPGAERIRESGRGVTPSMLMTTEVRKKTEEYTGTGGRCGRWRPAREKR
jgi:hypothetical protein